MTDLHQDHENPVLESVIANAIGFEMFRYRGTSVRPDGVEELTIGISSEELDRCRLAAKRALAHLRTYEAEGFLPPQ